MPKYINIKEFREKGYLQEVNRRFFHPLGLALEVIQNENEILGGIWDYRDDPEGIYYNLKNSDQDRKDLFKQKKKYIDDQFDKFKKTRIDILGFDIEPVNEE